MIRFKNALVILALSTTIFSSGCKLPSLYNPFKKPTSSIESYNPKESQERFHSKLFRFKNHNRNYDIPTRAYPDPTVETPNQSQVKKESILLNPPTPVPDYNNE